MEDHKPTLRPNEVLDHGRIPDRPVHAIVVTIVFLQFGRPRHTDSPAVPHHVPTHKAQNTISRYIPKNMPLPVGLEMEGFHFILADIAQRTRHTSGAALSHDLDSHKIMIPTVTTSMSLFKDSKHRNIRKMAPSQRSNSGHQRGLSP